MGWCEYVFGSAGAFGHAAQRQAVVISGAS